MVVVAISSKVNGSYKNVRTKVWFLPWIPLFPDFLLLLRIQMCFRVGNSFLLLSLAFSYSHWALPLEHSGMRENAEDLIPGFLSQCPMPDSRALEPAEVIGTMWRFHHAPHAKARPLHVQRERFDIWWSPTSLCALLGRPSRGLSEERGGSAQAQAHPQLPELYKPMHLTLIPIPAPRVLPGGGILRLPPLLASLGFLFQVFPSSWSHESNPAAVLRPTA